MMRQRKPREHQLARTVQTPHQADSRVGSQGGPASQGTPSRWWGRSSATIQLPFPFGTFLRGREEDRGRNEKGGSFCYLLTALRSGTQSSWLPGRQGWGGRQGVGKPCLPQLLSFPGTDSQQELLFWVGRVQFRLKGKAGVHSVQRRL